jgi:hypothetical protein
MGKSFYGDILDLQKQKAIEEGIKNSKTMNSGSKKR